MLFFKESNYIHTDCYGVTTSINPREAYKLLAREAQAVEFLLMSSLFNYVKSGPRKEIDICLWQHDGVCLFIARNPERHFKHIDRHLKDITTQLGIHTHFEYERL